MGHMALGDLARTREWVEVIDLIAAGADVSHVANSTISAAESAFSYAGEDIAYIHAVSLLTQLALAAFKERPVEYLRSIGVPMPAKLSVAGIAVALTEAFDAYCDDNGGHSDLGELAQRAMVHAVIERLEKKLHDQQSMFDLHSEHTEQALCEFGKQSQFGELMRAFYSRLANECLGYFLSKTLASHVGEGQRFVTTNQMGQFQDALEIHCHEASEVVKKFSADWFSKHKYLEHGEIGTQSVHGYASYSLTKMKEVLDAAKVGSR